MLTLLLDVAKSSENDNSGSTVLAIAIVVVIVAVALFFVLRWRRANRRDAP
ncbi:MAG: hypothetical protein QOD38_1563 [Acidimicrobiaceae bacterium]